MKSKDQIIEETILSKLPKDSIIMAYIDKLKPLIKEAMKEYTKQIIDNKKTI